MATVAAAAAAAAGGSEGVGSTARDREGSVRAGTSNVSAAQLGLPSSPASMGSFVEDGAARTALEVRSPLGRGWHRVEGWHAMHKWHVQCTGAVALLLAPHLLLL